MLSKLYTNIKNTKKEWCLMVYKNSNKANCAKTDHEYFYVLLKAIFSGSLAILFIGVCAFAILFIAMCLL